MVSHYYFLNYPNQPMNILRNGSDALRLFLHIPNDPDGLHIDSMVEGQMIGVGQADVIMTSFPVKIISIKVGKASLVFP